MKRLMIKLSMSTILILPLFSCSDDSTGNPDDDSIIIELKSHEKFINATWRHSELWVITEDTIANVYRIRAHCTILSPYEKITIKNK